jgi:hypothetical protein
MDPQELQLDLVVGGTLPIVTSNFQELKAAISARLETYRIQVTEENLAQAKKDATELGKAATQLNKLKTEKAKEFSAPVEAFKAQVMELVAMIQEGQEFIKKQVAAFEEKTKALCLKKMTSALKGAYLTLGVTEEYQTGFPELSQMVGISKITKSGELTKAAKDSVMALATAARGRQDRINGRLATLAADCYAAGLKSPLTRAHVEIWLQGDDATYKAGLERLIAIEVRRQQDTLKAEQDRMEREAREKAERESREKREAERIQEAKEREALQKHIAEETAKEDARIAAEKAKEAPAPLPAPAALPQAPAAPPVSSFPLPPVKRIVSVVVTFEIETAKTSPADLEKTASWFRSQIQAIPHIPAFRLEIK